MTGAIVRAIVVGALSVVLAACATMSSQQTSYLPTALQMKVDRSFSALSIDTPLVEAEPHLTRIAEGDCAARGECDWRDAESVRHYFWGDDSGSLHIVVKTVRADEFAGRRIRALGIGNARNRTEVVEAIRKFAPDMPLECDESSCGATLVPGWITVRFDDADQLAEVRFDGYHFT